MESDLAYLDPGFDASKLTKPQLRSILAEHGVTNLPPTTAKKEVLLGLFETHISGKAEEIKRARKAVKASGQGIAFLDDQSQPSPKMSSKASSGTPSRRRSPSRSPSKKATPIKKPVEVKAAAKMEEEVKRPRGRPKKKVEPDQPATSKTRSKSRKMKDLDEMRQEIITPSTPIRALQSSLPTFTDSPRSAMMKLQRRLGYIASANNMSLAQESITKMVKPVQSTSFFGKLARKAGFVLLAALKFTLAFVMTIVLAVYLRWKFVYPLPYCDSGAMPKPFFPEVDLVTSLKTLCLTCPEHGHCSSGKLVCDEGHLRQRSWLWLGETCVPDWKRMSKAEDLAKKIKQVLRERQGSFQCRQCPTPTMTEQALKTALRSRFKKAPWATADFDSYYKLALQELAKDPEGHSLKILGGTEEGEQRLFLSTVAILSYRCQLYLVTSAFIEAYRFYLIAISLLAVLAIYQYFKWQWSRAEKRKVDELVQTVLQCLAEQDALNRRDPTRPATLSVPQLRDALFMNAPASDKTRLWPKVCDAISNNSNVRESVMSIKGEQHRVWEWIGMDVLAPFTRSASSTSSAPA